MDHKLCEEQPSGAHSVFNLLPPACQSSFFWKKFPALHLLMKKYPEKEHKIKTEEAKNAPELCWFTPNTLPSGLYVNQ